MFTDNRALVFEDGSEAVFVSRGDGMGISLLRRINIPMIVISSETNPVVAARCKKLQLEYVHGVEDKLPVLRDWAAKNGIGLGETAYVGNDVNDVECMKAVGIAIAPADAHETALAVANIVLSVSGGNGAVREVADMIIDVTQ